MPDLNTPGEQDPSRQQDPGQDWKARFDGALRKIEQLTLENRRLNDELVTLTSKSEQLASQLSLKDTEKNVAIGERDKRLQETMTSMSGIQGQLAELQALKLKVDVTKKMGRTDLMPILDSIPNMTDATALEAVLTTFAEFTDGRVKAREKELMAGITPGVSSQQAGPTAPSTPDAMMKHIEALPLGSKERQKAMDQLWEMQMKQGA